MLQTDDLKLLAALAHADSLSAAARALSVTTPALSTRLKKIEAHLGIDLAVRTSRHMALNEEGQTLAAQAQALLAQLEALSESTRGRSAAMRAKRGQAAPQLQGRLRITAPFGFGRQHVAPLVSAFASQHPRLQITLDLLETPWPDRRDADVVFHIGSTRDSSWVAHPIAHNERWLCASPTYVKAHGKPLSPKDLAQHACIGIRENQEDVHLWHYRKGTTTRTSQRIEPALTSNDGEVARRWAEDGLGVVLRSQWDAAPLIKEGRLIRLLSNYEFESADIVALVPSRKGMTQRVQHFVAFAKARLSQKKW